MGQRSEFSLSVRLFLKTYRWRVIDPVPCAPLQRPLSESKIGLVSSAGFVLPDQEPFDQDLRGGDWALREIPDGIDPQILIESHRSETFDHDGVQSDPNLAFPIDRVHELAEAGRIGSVNHRHFSFMGSISAPGRFLKHTVPSIVSAFVEDQVDVALLVPV
jgi:D-proline reductase (dithiol) PrdB